MDGEGYAVLFQVLRPAWLKKIVFEPREAGQETARMIPQCRGHGCNSGVTLVSL